MAKNVSHEHHNITNSIKPTRLTKSVTFYILPAHPEQLGLDINPAQI
jgi:hypothetical protein